jgi:hypothetical protein
MHIADTDPTRRTPGQYARETVMRLRMRTLVALGVLAVATAGLGRGFGLHDVRFTGEEHVGGLLDELEDSGWEVIHDASLGRGNVDHILIGPAGVFTVETKSHMGPIRVGRLHGALLSQAQAQRKAIERVTGVTVEPLLVFSRAWVDRPLARRKGVRVVPARMLLGYLNRREPVLSRAEIGRAHSLVVSALLESGQRRPVASDRWRLIR